METLQSLQGRIRAADDLHAVVRTMKSLAAAGIRQYEEAVRSQAEYARTLELALAALARNHPECVQLHVKPARDDAAHVLVAIGSEQGMCGQFNRETARAVVERLATLRAARVLVVGGRLRAELEGAEVTVDAQSPLPDGLPGVTEAVETLLLQLDRWKQAESIDHVEILHQRPVSPVVFRPERTQLLPMDGAWLARLAEEPWPTRVLPMVRMEAIPLLADLLQRWLFSSVFRALAESLAAENAARLASMQAAEQNVEERLDDLVGRYHRRRQSQITEELLDVTAGFEMLGNP